MRNIIIIILLVFAGCDNENQIDEVNEIENYSNPSSSINMANINVNNDDITDFYFTHENVGTTDEPMSAATRFIALEPKNNYLLYKINYGYLPFAEGELIGESMDSGFSWHSYSAQLININWHIEHGWDDSWSGSWVDINDGYLPFALDLNDGLHYGWIKMSVESVYDSVSITITDYGYNLLPGEPIIAGE